MVQIQQNAAESPASQGVQQPQGEGDSLVKKETQQMPCEIHGKMSCCISDVCFCSLLLEVRAAGVTAMLLGNTAASFEVRTL